MIKDTFIALLLLFIIFGFSCSAYAKNSNEHEILLKDKFMSIYISFYREPVHLNCGKTVIATQSRARLRAIANKQAGMKAN